jgi:hypothetical protein
MILALDCEEGIIKIGSPPEALPGIVESINISASLLMDNAEMQGRSGKTKIVQGWDDAALLITLSLIDNPDAKKSRWDYLKQVAGVFKKVGDDGKPEAYSLSHPMINAWKTRQVLFSSLESTEYRTRRKVAATLKFVEYDNSAGVAQDRQSTASQAQTQTNQANVAAAQERMLASSSQRAGLGKLEERFSNL